MYSTWCNLCLQHISGFEPIEERLRWDLRRKFLPRQVVRPWTGCPELLWMPHPWVEVSSLVCPSCSFRWAGRWQSLSVSPSCLCSLAGYELLFQPEVVRIYISLLKESKTPAILEASAGAIQNLCAGSWTVSVRAGPRGAGASPVGRCRVGLLTWCAVAAQGDAVTAQLRRGLCAPAIPSLGGLGRGWRFGTALQLLDLHSLKIPGKSCWPGLPGGVGTVCPATGAARALGSRDEGGCQGCRVVPGDCACPGYTMVSVSPPSTAGTSARRCARRRDSLPSPTSSPTTASAWWKRRPEPCGTWLSTCVTKSW